MKLLLTTIFIAIQFAALANNTDTSKPYNPLANAKADIDSVIKLAKSQNKNVLLMIGGNWCSWCIRFNKMVNGDVQLDSALHANYILYHLNYSKENKNKDLLVKYSFPQRFGYPVFVVLNDKGDRLHTQNSSYLEEGKGYSKAKILEFFDNWSPRALSAESYKD